jgi:hypothetical protein
MKKYQKLAKQLRADADEIKRLRAEVDHIGNQISKKVNAGEYDYDPRLDGDYYRAELAWQIAVTDLREEVQAAYAEVPYDKPAQQGIDQALNLLLGDS